MTHPQLTREKIKQSEILRYLGYRGQKADQIVTEQIDECVEEALQVMQPRFVYRRFSLTFLEENTMEAGGLVLKSRNLSTNLRGCREVIYFAATLGNGVDRLMTRFEKLNITKAAILQAIGAAAIEAYCDQCQASLEEELKKEHLFLRPRFSPGYGDLPLSIQERFLDTIEATKRAGIYLSQGDIMLPEKSVTAIMGVSEIDNHCRMEGCEACSNMTCVYRRNSCYEESLPE